MISKLFVLKLFIRTACGRCEKLGELIRYQSDTRQVENESNGNQMEISRVNTGRTAYLQILLAMEHDRFGFHFSVLNVDFVTGENDRNRLANSDQISVPVRYVLVGDSRGDVEHDDRALALNVVAVSQAAEFLLTSGVL